MSDVNLTTLGVYFVSNNEGTTQNITYEVVSVDGSSIVLRIKFSDPNSVSMDLLD